MGFGTHLGRLALSYPYAACGQSSASRRRLPLAMALHLAHALSRVLAAIHAAGVAHKDVKPQNILVNETGTHVLLIDVGIASFSIGQKDFSPKLQISPRTVVRSGERPPARACSLRVLRPLVL